MVGLGIFGVLISWFIISQFNNYEYPPNDTKYIIYTSDGSVVTTIDGWECHLDNALFTEMVRITVWRNECGKNKEYIFVLRDGWSFAELPLNKPEHHH